jgi:hypothetical protein
MRVGDVMSDRPIVESEPSDLYQPAGSVLRANRSAFVASLIGEELLARFRECAREFA